MRPLVKKQLTVMTAASVVGLVVLAWVFLRVPEALGIGRYDVKAEFVKGAGLYPGALVNFRGQPAGKVRSLDLADDAVVANLRLKNGIDIPKDVTAEIHSVSAVGEQYVELVPEPNASAADLADGDRIDVEHTSVPVQIGPVLDNVYALVKSLPRHDLQSVVHEAGTALNGRDTDLQTILDGGKTFVDAANKSFPQTKELIKGAEPLLATVNSKAADIRAFTHQLDQVTSELRAGDADLRQLLASGPSFAAETTDLLKQLDPILPALLGPLNSITGVLSTYQDNLRQLLSDYPTALAIVQSVNYPHLADHQLLLTVANYDKPGACLAGFDPPSKWRSPDDTSTLAPKLTYCTLPHGDPRAVKGARNIPCPNDPSRREPLAVLCRQ